MIKARMLEKLVDRRKDKRRRSRETHFVIFLSFYVYGCTRGMIPISIESRSRSTLTSPKIAWPQNERSQRNRSLMNSSVMLSQRWPNLRLWFCERHGTMNTNCASGRESPSEEEWVNRATSISIFQGIKVPQFPSIFLGRIAKKRNFFLTKDGFFY